MLGRSCLQFATMVAATLEGVLVNFLTLLRLLPKSKSSLITCLFSCFPFFVSSDIRSSQLISPRLTSSQLISCESRCVARKMWLKTYCANNNALIPLKFRTLITCLLSVQIYQFTVLRVYGKFCKFTKFSVLRSETGMLRS